MKLVGNVTELQIEALQRAIRDLQLERRGWLNEDVRYGIELSVTKLRDHIKRLRKRAAKGAGT